MFLNKELIMKSLNICVDHSRGEFGVEVEVTDYTAESFLRMLEEDFEGYNEDFPTDLIFLDTAKDGTVWVCGDETSNAFVDVEDGIGYKITITASDDDSDGFLVSKIEWPGVKDGINVTYLNDDVVEIFVNI